MCDDKDKLAYTTCALCGSETVNDNQSRVNVYIKKLEKDLEAYGKIFGSAFSIVLNANDFYGYACADATQIDLPAFNVLYRLARAYGSDGIAAAMSTASGSMPIEPHQTDKFKEAMESISEHEEALLKEEDFASDWAELHARAKECKNRYEDLYSRIEDIAGIHEAYMSEINSSDPIAWILAVQKFLRGENKPFNNIVCWDITSCGCSYRKKHNKDCTFYTGKE